MIAYCSICKDKKEFSIKSQYAYKASKKDVEKEYVFAVCEHCESPSLFAREDPIGIGYEFWDCDIRLYPKDERIVSYSLPELVKRSYEEAVKCENAKAFIAATVMVGRALEAVCKDYVPEVKTIDAGLKKMKENGLISDELLEWSNELRFLRNQGAHATEREFSVQDAKESLDFMQAIMEILYHLRPKFNEMKERHTVKPAK